MEPIYRVLPDETGVRRVTRVDQVRLLSPAEREAARREREEKRREVAERAAKRRPKPPPQEPGRGTDYYG
jgi:hypothetical protein